MTEGSQGGWIKGQNAASGFAEGPFMRHRPLRRCRLCGILPPGDALYAASTPVKRPFKRHPFQENRLNRQWEGSRNRAVTLVFSKGRQEFSYLSRGSEARF